MEYRYHSLVGQGRPQAATKSRKKREIRSSPPLAWEIGAENNRGTNIQHVALDRSSRKQILHGRVSPDGVLPRELSSPSSEVSLLTVTGGVVVGLLAVILTAFAVRMHQGKKGARRKDAPKEPGSREPMMPSVSRHSDGSEV